MRQGGYPVHEVVFSHHLIQWPTNSRACSDIMRRSAFRQLCLGFLIISYLQFQKCLVKETDRNGRVIYCKTPLVSFAQLKPLFFLFLCYCQISHHLECGVCVKPPSNSSLGEGCHYLHQKNRKYLAEYFAYQRRCSVSTMVLE